MKNIDTIYAKAYTEVLIILRTLPKNEYEKIPNDVLAFYNKYQDTNYQFNYNPEKPLDQQSVSVETKSIIVSLFRDFFATDNQKEKLKIILKQNEQILEKKKKERYNSDNLFNKRKQLDINEDYDKPVAIIEYKETIFQKIVNKLKKFFNLKQG